MWYNKAVHERVRAKVFCRLAETKGGLLESKQRGGGIYDDGIRGVFTDDSGRHTLG